MTNLSVAAIRAIHTVYAEARMETKAVRRGGKMEVDIQLKPVEGPESGDDSLPDFIRERARMDVVRPGSPIPEWPSGAAGPTRSGLRAVLKLEPLRDTYSIGDTIECWFVVQNAGDEPIEFSTLTFIQDAKAEAFDLNDEPIEVQSTWFSGVSPHAHFRLAPGEQVEIRASSIGIGKGEFSHPVGTVIEAKAGDICRLQFEFKIPGVQGSDGSGRVTVPAAGEWIGRMKTGEVQFRVVDKEQPEDSRDGS
jgi:hypothetical protein